MKDRRLRRFSKAEPGFRFFDPFERGEKNGENFERGEKNGEKVGLVGFLDCSANV